jgi:uncharacterized damage-inducible protein DinB
MVTIQDFLRMLTIEQSLVQTQTQGLTQADTLIQPQPSGNCMNWVLGHTLENQVILLKLLGGETPIPETDLANYQRESASIRADGPGVLPIERLLEYHQQVQEALAARLTGMQDSDFAQEVPFRERSTTLGWRVFFLYFHYTYHIGQLELLRQLAGKTEKLI